MAHLLIKPCVFLKCTAGLGLVSALAAAASGCSATGAAAGHGDGGEVSSTTGGGSAGDGGAGGAATSSSGSGGEGGCSAGGEVCGGACCGAGEFCDQNQVCCAFAEACGTSCCGAGEVCEGAVCHLDCGDASLRCADAAGVEVCCAAGQVCSFGTCFTPTTSCADFIDCPDGQYCEPSVMNGTCLPQPSGEECQQAPTGASLLPDLLWAWPSSAGSIAESTSVQVMMSPMVANLNDDNGDGRVDTGDIPDVVFVSFAGGNYWDNGILRAVSGSNGATLWSVTDTSFRVNPGGQIAIGNIDSDPEPEIVACRTTTADAGDAGPLVALNHDGTPLWTSTNTNVRCGEAAPGIADLDGDGAVEVFVRYTVVRGADGSYIDHETCDGIGNVGDQVRYEHDPCDYSTAADLDGDGTLELVGGNVAFHFNAATGLTPLWDFRSCTSSPNCRSDGYPAVADLDLDGDPEVVVVESSWLWPDSTPSAPAYTGDHWMVVRDGATGAVVAGPVDNNRVAPPSADAAACITLGGQSVCRTAGGGPPTIGNFDTADAAPEIALAGAYNYVVFDVDLAAATPAGRVTELWHRSTHDNSSRKTGSSVFDFDGDGAAEVIYNDQDWFRVYDGTTGDTRYCRCNNSATLFEYPVIADVDNNGHADIVLAGNTLISGSCSAVAGDECTATEVAAGRNTSSAGVRVLRGPGEGWVRTRRIWNQHTYHVTNVTEDGRIPQHEASNWANSALNNFRLNVQPGATNQPDLRPRNASIDLVDCPQSMRVFVEVYNAGWSAAPAGVPVSFYGGAEGALVYFGAATTTRMLLPGQHELLSLPYPVAADEEHVQHAFRIVIDDPSHMPLSSLVECRPDNNTAETSGLCFGEIN
jgi:hypothetical protein